ncbi:MAG: T9SS type A sorting domain-containing protein [Bacteroidetes bacterium]|nr:T9SS type A sorting domain-containing protein [Bacteroidota bacterium]
MKKVYLLLLFCTVSVLSFGQMFFYESFDAGQMPPTGWTIDGIPAQWSASNSNNAGGNPPEAKFTYTNGTTTTRLISPMVDLSGKTSVKFSFTHYYDWYSNPAPKVGVATRSHSGAWTSVYEITPTGNVGPVSVDIDITNGDVGQSEFQVCIYLNGNMFNLDYYYCDNLLLYTPLNLDAGLVSISATPTYFSDPVDVKGTIMNLGTTTINHFDVTWQKDGEPSVYLTGFTGLSIPQQGTYDFTSAFPLGAAIGSHNLKVWISNINGDVDDNQNDDTLTKVVNRVCNVIPRVPLCEEFTSSTCSPCAQFNADFVPWCNDKDTAITLIKYQMNWPSPGDPYYTEEGGVRRDYYGVGFVPDLYTNGAEVATDISAVQAAYDQATAQIGMMKMVVSHTLAGHVITVDATVLPFTNFTNCHVYIVVMEQITYNNHMTNGETSFEHVMMKMLPDAGGTAVSFTDRVPVSFHQVADLTATHMERWNDIIVGVFVQDDATREVYQSIYSMENGTFNTEARLENILVNSVSVPGFSPDVFTYNVTLPGGTTNVPDIVGTPMDPKETVIVVPGISLPGSSTIDVFSESLKEHNLYTVNYSFAVGQKENKADNVSVAPNPTSGMIRIYGAPHSTITIYSGSGVLCRTLNDFTGPSLNLTDLSKGVYILNIQKEDNTVIRKKVVLL